MKYNTNESRFYQVYFKDENYVSTKPVIPSVFPGEVALSTGTEVVAKNNITAENSVTATNNANRGPIYLNCGKIGFNESGAD